MGYESCEYHRTYAQRNSSEIRIRRITLNLLERQSLKAGDTIHIGEVGPDFGFDDGGIQIDLQQQWLGDLTGKLCWRISNELPSNIISKDQVPYGAIQVINGNLYALDFWGENLMLMQEMQS